MMPSRRSATCLSSVMRFNRAERLASDASVLVFTWNRVASLEDDEMLSRFCLMPSPSAAELVITTTFFGPEDLFIMMVGTRVKPSIMRGKKMVVNRNDLVRTRSRNSLRANRKMLRIDFAYDLPEDLVQRGL